MAKGIEAASGVVEGWKVIRKLQATPPEGALLVGFGGVVMGLKAAKLLPKGLKVSKKILASLHSSNVVLKGRVGGAIVEKRIQEKLTSIAKGFNAVYGALMVVQFSKSFGGQLQVAKLPDWNSFLKGYKLSKSFLSILDAVIGKEFGVFAAGGKGFLVIKKIVGGVGIIVKAASLSKEISIAVLKRLAIPEGTIAAAFGADFHGKHRQAPIDGSHQNKLKRMLCMTPNEGTLSPLLLVLLPSSPVRQQSFSLFVFLVKSFTETSQNACVLHHLEEDDLFGIFSLAIPMPTSEILLLV